MDNATASITLHSPTGECGWGKAAESDPSPTTTEDSGYITDDSPDDRILYLPESFSLGVLQHQVHSTDFDLFGRDDILLSSGSQREPRRISDGGRDSSPPCGNTLSSSIDEGLPPHRDTWSSSSSSSSSSDQSDQGYKSASESSVVSSSRKTLISRLMDEICSSFFSQACYRPRQQAQGEANSYYSDSMHGSFYPIISNDKDSVTNQRKRARDDDEDPKENGKRKLRRGKEPDITLADVRYFACPFHKFSVSIYSSRNKDPRLALKFRSCGPPAGQQSEK